MKRKSCIATAVVALVVLTTAVAGEMVQGVVVAGERNCKKSDRVVIYTNMGYVIAQQYSGSFDKDDKVVGDLNSFGFKDVLVNGRSARLYIDDYMASRTRASEKCFQD